MKRILLCFVIALLLILTLCSCGTVNEESSVGDTEFKSTGIVDTDRKPDPEKEEILGSGAEEILGSDKEEKPDSDTEIKGEDIQPDDGKMHVYMASPSDSGSSKSVPAYSRWSERRSQSSSAKKEVSVDILGKSISGKYYGTYYQMPNNYETHEYKNNNTETFRVNAKTGKLTYYSRFYSIPDDTVKIIDEATATDIAKKLVSAYANVSEYTVSANYHTETKTYGIYFYKKSGDWVLEDGAIVQVLGTGEIVSFRAAMLGEMSSDMTIDADREEIGQKALDMFKEARKDIDAEYDEVTYSCGGGSVTFDENGKLIAIYTVQMKTVSALDERFNEVSNSIIFIVVTNFLEQ